MGQTHSLDGGDKNTQVTPKLENWILGRGRKTVHKELQELLEGLFAQVQWTGCLSRVIDCNEIEMEPQGKDTYSLFGKASACPCTGKSCKVKDALAVAATTADQIKQWLTLQCMGRKLFNHVWVSMSQLHTSRSMAPFTMRDS